MKIVAQGPPTLKLFYPMVTEFGILIDSNPSIRDKTKGLNEDA